MKILFLQNTDDAVGGISRVNISLMASFAERGAEVNLISLRHSGKKDLVEYPYLEKNVIINILDIWERPLYSLAVKRFLQGEFRSAFQVIVKRWKYDQKLKKDYALCRSKIQELAPDIIINSHYELLEAIPTEFLKRTINHFHTSFDQVVKNKSCLRIFKKYNKKIGKFVWLTKATAQRAIAKGFINSTFIYNPLTFSSDQQTSYVQKSVIFLGRFSPEKRLGLAVRLFNEVIQENNIKDWYLDIYGTGELDRKLKQEIDKSKYVFLCGSTDDVPGVMLKHSICVLTSEFEGMALVVLEANECGLPVVSFDFGESVWEEILDGKTGYIVCQGDEYLYKKRLLSLMRDQNLRENVGKNAKEFVSRFYIENVVKDWWDLIHEIQG